MSGSNLKSLGVFLIIIGAGSWILPLFGLQFKLLVIPSLLLGVPEFVSSIIFLVAGVALYYISSKLKAPTSTIKKAK